MKRLVILVVWDRIRLLPLLIVHALKGSALRTLTPAPDSRASWKLGFPDDASSDKKHEQPKEGKDNNADYEKWKQHFYQFIKENPQFVPVLKVHLNFNCPSSVGSVDSSKCRLDSITEQTPCSLHIPLGRRRRIVEVAKGIVDPCSRIFRNKPIHPDYAKVFVLEVVNSKYNHEMDYPFPDEGIETVGDAVNKFILWHRGDIILDTQSLAAAPN